MSAVIQQILVLVMTNAGGVGKSSWAEILAAFARLAGLDVVVADVDAGNRGYLNRNGDASAVSLDWSPKNDSDGTTPADPMAWFDKYVAGKNLAILDTGANMLAAANPISQFIGGLIQVAKARGVRIIVYGVTSPNKAGADELVEAMYARFNRAAEVVVVQNDRDGSSAFSASLAALGTPLVSLPFISPGLQALRLRRAVPLDDMLSVPESGYESATALIAARLMPAARQDAVVDVVGERAAAALAPLAAGAPPILQYQIVKLKQATNAAIDANVALAQAWRVFRGSDTEDDAALLRAARELHDADRKFYQFR